MKKTSTTNILAKIFKKTPEKKVKKKTKAKVAKKPTPPKAKVIKKNISVKKTKTIKATPTKIKKNLKTVSKKAGVEREAKITVRFGTIKTRASASCPVFLLPAPEWPFLAIKYF